MALFNNFDIAAVIGEALQHNSQVLENDLQPYNDMLFNIISDEIKTNREHILEEFKTKIKETPGNVKVVSVPLWSYNTRFFNTSREKYRSELAKLSYRRRLDKVYEDRDLRKVDENNGWHWMIGVLSPVQWFDEDTNWNVQPVPVDLVVRKTDLLQRLSNLFQGHVWVTREYLGYVHDDDRCRVDKMVLQANFFVNGLEGYGGRAKALKKVADKYTDCYQEYVPEEGYHVTLIGPGIETAPDL